MITFTNSVFMANITAFPTLAGLHFLITLTKSRWMTLNLMPVIALLMSTIFFEHWLHDIRIETVLENSNLKSPFCLAGNRMPGATLADETAKTLALFNAIIHADETTTVREIRPLIDDLDTVRFNRPKVNRQLNRLNLDSPELEPIVIWL